MPTATRKKTSKKTKRPAAKKTANPLGPGLFQFLGELALNNEREWFNANKDRYEFEVREPVRAFIRAMAPHVAKVSKQLVVSDKKVGGSLMRIHRDIRFSTDKTPYKTNVGMHFRHAAGKDVHAPGIYLHLEVGSVFLGVGMWRPDKDALAALRGAIVDKPAAWKKVRDGVVDGDEWSFGGETLKRPPRGFDGDHPLIDDLKRKGFIAVVELDATEVTAPDFADRIGARMREAKPLLAWQAKALGLAF